jgi:hypothetical protein
LIRVIYKAIRIEWFYMKYKLLVSFFCVHFFLHADDKLQLLLSDSCQQIIHIMSSRPFLLFCSLGIIGNTIRKPLTAPFFRVPSSITNDYQNGKATLLWKKIQLMNTCQKTSIDQCVRNNRALFPHFGGEDEINTFIGTLKERILRIQTLEELKALMFDEEVLRENDSYRIRPRLENFQWRVLSDEEKLICNLKTFLNYFDSMIAMKLSYMPNITIITESSLKIMMSFLELLFIPSVILFFKK